MLVWSVIRSGRWKLMQSIKELLGLTYECWCEVWSVALSARFAQPTRWASCIVVLASLQRRKCTTMVSRVYFLYTYDKQVRLSSVCLLAVLIIFIDKIERCESLAGQWETVALDRSLESCVLECDNIVGISTDSLSCDMYGARLPICQKDITGHPTQILTVHACLGKAKF